jgi:hypothetical protein
VKYLQLHKHDLLIDSCILRKAWTPKLAEVKLLKACYDKRKEDE